MNGAKHFGNARAYKGVLSALRSFHKFENLRFEKVTFAYLKRLETWHLKRETV